MDARTSLRKRVGDTPLVRAPHLSKAAGLPNLWLKMEGANPTGTQKDRIARLEAGEAVALEKPGITVASCGNFGVAIAHAAFVHKLPCTVFVPEDFRGERIETMESLGAKVERAPGQYEDAVQVSRQYAVVNGWFDANPGGASTLRTLVGYSTIATEIVARVKGPIASVGVPIGNGSTLAGVHLGFRTAWAQAKTKHIPKILGGSSQGNNPVPIAVARGLDSMIALDPRAVIETDVNEPLVNWDALDGQAALIAIQDAGGKAYGFTDDELMTLHAALRLDGIDAHPASLAAVSAIAQAVEDGLVARDDTHVAVMTSGRPRYHVEQVTEVPDDMDAFVGTLNEWLGRYGDPAPEAMEAVRAAFAEGFVLRARDMEGHAGYCILTPMELSEFFPKYHLSYIAVAEGARGRGLGTILLEEAIRLTEGKLSLHVDIANQGAIQLYEKFGFAKKYYRMLYKGPQTTEFDPSDGSGWNSDDEPATTEPGTPGS